jgi:hypothetical protein
MRPVVGPVAQVNSPEFRHLGAKQFASIRRRSTRKRGSFIDLLIREGRVTKTPRLDLPFRDGSVLT